MLEQDIKHWLAEDIGDGDHTTLCCIPADAIGRSRLIVKDTGIIAGIEVAKKVFEIFDRELRITQYMHDGDEVKPQDIAFEVEGKVRSLLQTERLMLNIMQRMSGIATRTREYVKLLEGTRTRVLDTRKTTAYARERGCANRWRLQPQDRLVRYDTAQRQPYRLRRRYIASDR